jgi:hypothetical protein
LPSQTKNSTDTNPGICLLANPDFRCFSLNQYTKTISIAGTCLVPIDPSLLKKCPLGEDVDVAAERDALVIRPVQRTPRQGWAETLAVVPAEALERDTTELAAFRETPQDRDSKEWEW